jgi:lysyl-tRNA synthetase class 2
VSVVAPLQKYYENRLKRLGDYEKQGNQLYPHKFVTTISIPDFVEKYSGLEKNFTKTDELVSIAGTAFNILLL